MGNVTEQGFCYATQNAHRREMENTNAERLKREEQEAQRRKLNTPIMPDPASPNTRECPSCGAVYYLSDYREDAGHWFCSSCQNELQRG